MMTKEERAVWIAQALERAGIALYGRASRISKDLGCAKADATGWLNGSLPRDMELAFRFADFYEIDIREWVTGEKTRAGSEPDRTKVADAIRLVKRFEADTEIGWGVDDFVEQVMTVLDDPKYQQRYHADVVSFLEKTKTKKERGE